MGVRDERVEDIFFEPLTGDPTEEGQVRLTSSDLRGFINGQVRSLVGGLDAAGHALLDELVHDLAETHEQIPTFDADGVMTSLVAQGVGGGTVIRDVDQLTADADGLITGARVRQRDAAGAVVQTLTSVVTNTGSVPQANVVTRT